jgi:hypothetical protein
MDKKPEHITQADWDAHYRELRARALAHAAPLPGPIGDVLATAPPRVGPYQLREVNFDDFVILRRLGNPFAETLAALVSGDSSVKAPFLSETQLREVVFLWAYPVEESDRLLADGEEAFRTAAHSLRLGLPISAMFAVAGALIANLQRAISTMVEYGASSAGEGFRAQPGHPQTGSAGGGSLSAD